MLKHLRSTIASLLAAVLLVSALTVPAAADTGAVKDTSFNHDIEQVQDIQVINRGLHVSYAVTNQNDRAAIISALNALTVAPMRKERGEEDGLRLLTVLMTNGDRYNYWCYEDDVLQSDGGWQANGRQLDGLYAAMTRCQQTYPANIEWLGYMNPYRVTKAELSGAVLDGDVVIEKSASYDSAASQAQRDKILDLCAKLKNVKVGTVRRFNGDGMEKARTDGAYRISMSFEDGKKDYYALQIPNSLTDGKGEIWISVDSIGYDLCYTANDAALLKELTDTLASLLSN